MTSGKPYRDGSDPKDPNKRVKKTLNYCPLKTALKPYSWSSLTRVQTKDLNPAVVFTVLGKDLLYLLSDIEIDELLTFLEQSTLGLSV